jgi:DNA-directed RNA polymerase sigma subunit (sigma70/sigma32)
MELALSRRLGQPGYADFVDDPDDLDAVLAQLSNAQQAVQDARRELHSLIRQMIAHGPRGTQAEVARRTGYTRERIRQIVRNEAP